MLTRINARPGTESLAFWGYTVIALTYMLILLLIGTSNSIITKFIFCNKFIIEFGRKSYFIYLFQGFIGLALSFLIHFIYPSISAHWCEWLLFLIMPFVLVFAAKVSWQLFENPFLKIGHKFKY